MHIEKATIVRHLRAHGRHEDAIRADRELPDRIHDSVGRRALATLLAA